MCSWYFLQEELFSHVLICITIYQYKILMFLEIYLHKYSYFIGRLKGITICILHIHLKYSNTCLKYFANIPHKYAKVTKIRLDKIE